MAAKIAKSDRARLFPLGFLKEKVYVEKTETVPELKKITGEKDRIDGATLGVRWTASFFVPDLA